MFEIARVEDLPFIVEILTQNSLPTEDLNSHIKLFVWREQNEIMGTSGLEIFNTEALLRSVSIKKDQQRKGIGKLLVENTEATAQNLGIQNLFLLTTSASAFFDKLGYQTTSRTAAPASIQQSSQFKGVCPSSATLMSKNLLRPKILVLCTGNSCRSQLMHGFLASLLNHKADIYSAGVETHGLNPRAIATMKEIGIDISTYTSDHISSYQHLNFDYVITVCDNARERCPYFSSRAKLLHHNFPDPAKASGTEEEIMATFSAVREQIRAYSQAFVLTLNI
jgi:arsenate reductase (thioredoxin)